MYANIIDMLKKKGLMKSLDAQKAEDLFLDMTEDEMLPERWRIDVQTFIGEEFPDIVEKYNIMKVEKNEGFNDLDKYLDEQILDNRSIDEITEDDKNKIKKEQKEKQKTLKEEVRKTIEEGFKDKEKLKEHLNGIKQRKEEELKAIQEEIERLEKGEKLKAQEQMEKEFANED